MRTKNYAESHSSHQLLDGDFLHASPHPLEDLGTSFRNSEHEGVDILRQPMRVWGGQIATVPLGLRLGTAANPTQSGLKACMHAMGTGFPVA